MPFSTTTDLRPTLSVSSTINVVRNEEGALTLTAGDSAERRYLYVAHVDFASVILTSVLVADRDGWSAHLASRLDLTADDANDMVDFLIANAVLTDAAAAEPTTAQVLWEEWSFRDAGDLHAATRNLQWLHDYSNDPEVMTRIGGKNVLPSAPAPTVPVSSGDRYELPAFSSEGMAPFGDAARARRTTRAFADTALPIGTLATLLSGATRNSRPSRKEFPFTIAPTRDLRYYVCAINVEGLPVGLFEYAPESHDLVEISLGDYSRDLIHMSQNGPFTHLAAAYVCVSVAYGALQWKYRFSHAYRFGLYEAAHRVSDMMYLAAALGLGAFLTPAIDDAEAQRVFPLAAPGESHGPERVIYLTAFGYEDRSRPVPRGRAGNRWSCLDG